ncbi:MAG: hypothetical protein HYT80_00230 [Euryarchaeota archaeon]|nr:hypothetical protein [Euryarchaeota archaeon]
MSSEASGSPGRRQTNVRLSPSQLVRPRVRRVAEADIRIDDGYVCVTLHVPEVEDSELRYSIRRRYLMVWGESAHREQHLVHLPRAVDPEQHNVRFQNGVVDARIKLKAP